MNESANNELNITREFNAPRDLVYKVCTEAEHMAHWWGPKGFEIQVAKLELRPGGMFLYCMKSPDGKEMWGRFVYKEIVAPERIVFINSFSNSEGAITANPWMPTWPLEVLNTLTLTEHDGKTTISLVGAPVNASQEEQNVFNAMKASLQQGFKGTFDQLDEYLSKMLS